MFSFFKNMRVPRKKRKVNSAKLDGKILDKINDSSIVSVITGSLKGKKTIGVALLSATLIRYIPAAQEFAKEDPIAYGELLASVMILMRFITGKVFK